MLVHRPTARLVRGLGAALLALSAIAPGASANVPTVGASRGSFPDIPDQIVSYRWGATTYPTWATGAAGAALAGYPNLPDNNSRGPRPVYSSSGTATVLYTAASSSPCNSLQNLQWLQCATNGGTTSFRIHIRNFDGAPYGDWRWYDKASSCLNASGVRVGGCWLVGRAMIHEAGHAIPTFGHDPQGEADTVMNAVSPQFGTVGGNRATFQRCDEAALQLLWDLADFSRAYADCFDGIAGHGVRGLITKASTSAATFTSCLGAARTVTGRLATAADSRYQKLTDNPLAGRILWFDRKRRVDTTWGAKVESAVVGAAVTGADWTRSFGAPLSTGGTWDYRAHFDGDVGLDPSNVVQFSITWSAAC